MSEFVLARRVSAPDRLRRPEDHAEASAHLHAHGHPGDVSTDEPFWHCAAEVFAAARTTLQLTSGLQLVGVAQPAAQDLRHAVLLRVRLLIDEAADRLRECPPPPPGEGPYVGDLRWCLVRLRAVARQQEDALTARDEPVDIVGQLEAIGDRLRGCQRYDIGIRFFGSGGCADLEHTLNHH